MFFFLALLVLRSQNVRLVGASSRRRLFFNFGHTFPCTLSQALSKERWVHFVVVVVLHRRSAWWSLYGRLCEAGEVPLLSEHTGCPFPLNAGSPGAMRQRMSLEAAGRLEHHLGRPLLLLRGTNFCGHCGLAPKKCMVEFANQSETLAGKARHRIGRAGSPFPLMLKGRSTSYVPASVIEG